MSLPPRIASWLLILWFAAALVWTWPSLVWQLEYYRTPGPVFYEGILIAAPLVGLASLAYAWLRGKAGLQRLESYLLLALGSPAVLFRPLPALAAAAVALSCYAIGRPILRRANPAGATTIECVSLSFALGFALASFVLFCLGIAGLFNVWTYGALTAGCFLPGRRTLAEPFAAARASIRDWSSNQSFAQPAVGVAVFFLLLAMVSGVALLLAPPIAYDAVNYHLPLAQAYATVGTLQAAPGERYSLYPQGFEVLLSWAHGLGGVEAARLLSAFFSLLMLAIAWSVARRVGLRRAACFVGLAAAAAMPALHFTAVTVKNDTALAAYHLAAFLCYLLWRDKRDSSWIALAAVFFAAGFGVKHTAFFPAVSLIPLGLHALWKSSGVRLRLAATAAAFWFALAGVWHLRAFVLTGNATYPYSAASMTAAAIVPDAQSEGSSASALGLLTSIPRTFVELHRDGSLVYESILPAPAGIFLALLLPAPLLFRRKRRHAGAAALFIYGSLAVWAGSMAALRHAVHADMTLRYAIPAFLLWPAALAAPSLDLYGRFTPAVKTIFLAFLAYAFLLPWTGLLIIENSGAQLRYLAGRHSGRDYLAGAMLPYAAIEAASSHAEPGDATLSFHGCAALFYPEPWNFHCRRPGRGTDPASSLAEELRRDNYSFLILPVADEPLAAGLPHEVLFRDDHYVTYRLTQSQ